MSDYSEGEDEPVELAKEILYTQGKKKQPHGMLDEFANSNFSLVCLALFCFSHSCRTVRKINTRVT